MTFGRSCKQSQTGAAKGPFEPQSRKCELRARSSKIVSWLNDFRLQMLDIRPPNRIESVTTAKINSILQLSLVCVIKLIWSKRQVSELSRFVRFVIVMSQPASGQWALNYCASYKSNCRIRLIIRLIRPRLERRARVLHSVAVLTLLNLTARYPSTRTPDQYNGRNNERPDDSSLHPTIVPLANCYNGTN